MPARVLPRRSLPVGFDRKRRRISYPPPLLDGPPLRCRPSGIRPVQFQPRRVRPAQPVRFSPPRSALRTVRTPRPRRLRRNRNPAPLPRPRRKPIRPPTPRPRLQLRRDTLGTPRLPAYRPLPKLDRTTHPRFARPTVRFHRRSFRPTSPHRRRPAGPPATASYVLGLLATATTSPRITKLRIRRGMPRLPAAVDWPNPPTTRCRVAAFAKPFLRLDLLPPPARTIRVADAVRHRSAKKRPPTHSRRPGTAVDVRTASTSARKTSVATAPVTAPVRAPQRGYVICRSANSAALGTVSYLSAVPIADTAETVDPPISASRSGIVFCRPATTAAAPVRAPADRIDVVPDRLAVSAADFAGVFVRPSAS